MAKQSVMARQRKREKLSNDITKRLQLKKIIARPGVTHEERMLAMRQLYQLPRDNSKTRSRSRCRRCGRPRSFIRRYALCRICFRQTASRGFIPGVRKASW